MNMKMSDLLTMLRANWLTILLLAAAVVAFLYLPSRSSPVASVDEVEQMLTGGQPTVVVFFNNF